MKSLKAFTLIELLIVVAIIAILAAIAVPNFLEAQVRAKVTRAKNDLRSLATALESYRTDFTAYPVDSLGGWENPPILGVPNPPLIVLTTPVAYVSSVPKDTFQNKQTNIGNTVMDYTYCARHGMITITENAAPGNGGVLKGEWILVSVGPDLRHSFGEWAIWGEDLLNKQAPVATFNVGMNDGALYDSTNGTMSIGDIVRIGP